MHRFFFYIIALIFLFLSTRVNAQTGDTTNNNYDTDALSLPVLTENDTTGFDSITASDAAGVTVRNADRTAVKKMQEDDDFWYHNTAPAPKKNVQNKKAQPYKSGTWLPYLLWTMIIGGFIAFLVWFLMNSNVQLFKSSSKLILDNTEELASEDIFEINFDSKIAAAIHAKDYRLVIRLMYLQLLTALSHKGDIDYSHQKTNNDHVRQLYATRYYKTFFQLTRYFEYTWYGKLQLSEERFGEIKKEFDGFKKEIEA